MEVWKSILGREWEQQYKGPEVECVQGCLQMRKAARVARAE